MSLDQPGFIVVEGPVGVGKTTLARRLADSFGSDLLLEGAHENPFLERFYREPRNAALQTQLFFLFQRARQLQDLATQLASEPVVDSQRVEAVRSAIENGTFTVNPDRIADKMMSLEQALTDAR